jgi:predicted Zn-dependent peptidase
MMSIATLDNGLAVVVEEIEHVESAAYVLYIPGGMIHDRPELQGCSLILSELTARGAGSFNSRALSEAFDSLGIRHSEGAGQDAFVYRGSLLAEYLEQALEYVALMVCEPRLPADEIPHIRSVLLQDLQSLDDNPAMKAVVELGRRYYPEPYGRSTLGTAAGLEASGEAEVREAWERMYHPGGAVLSVAGKVKAEQVMELARRKLGEWRGEAPRRPAFGELPPHGSHHLHSESAQIQIVLAYPSAPFGDPDYYPAKVAAAVLSGGMFGRLFVEVREKKGLCYSVYAKHGGTQDYGTVLAYAGTTPQRAHETLEVVVQQLRGVAGTVTQDELARAKVDLLSSLVIGEESSGSRAASNAGDWWVAKRVRTLEEIKQSVNDVGVEQIDRCLRRFPADSFVLLTLGSRNLNLERKGS